MRVDVWSDIVCPWCYIGKRRLEQAIARFSEPVEVVYHSFELDPSAPAVATESTQQHLASTYGMTVEQAVAAQKRVSDIAATEGLDYRLAETTWGNSFDAHRLLQLARTQGVQEQAKERLMRAYFTEAEAIGDPSVLRRLSAEAGLDAGEAASVLEGDAYADAVRDDERRAAELGIHGVPFFVIDGRYAVEGAQPADLLLSALQRAQADRLAAGDAA
ncbi:MAG: DsbA family oxidoreductase [Actinomycetota bacterium]